MKIESQTVSPSPVPLSLYPSVMMLPMGRLARDNVTSRAASGKKMLHRNGTRNHAQYAMHIFPAITCSVGVFAVAPGDERFLTRLVNDVQVR